VTLAEQSGKKKRSQKAIEATAHHEAGHAVAAFRNKLPIRSVTIERAEGASGQVSHANPLFKDNPEWDTSAKTQRRIEVSALVSLAGEAAQRKFNPRSVRHFHSADDRSNALHVLEYLSANEDEREAYYRLISIRARNFVNSSFNWMLITGLAQELLLRRTISGKQVKELLLRIISERASRGLRYGNSPEPKKQEK
jgi:hypothetical protein